MTLIANAPTYIIYPITDGERSNTLITTDIEDASKTEITFLGVDGDYGNLYWSDTEAKNVISWKGNYLRYFRIADQYNIPSISRYYSGRPLMTTFGYNIYKQGKIYASVSPYSPTATYIMGASEPSALIAICLLDTETSFQTVVYKTTEPNKDYLLCKWVELGRYSYGRNELPWFFDITGLKAIHPTGATIQINEELTAVTFTAPTIVNNLATQTVTETGTTQRFPTGLDVYILKQNGVDVILDGDYYWESLSFSRTFTGKSFVDFNTECTITMTSSTTSPPHFQKAEVRVKTVDATAIEEGELAIRGPAVWTGDRSAYSAVNVVGDATWTYPDNTDLCEPAGGTITVTDSCGRTASLDVAPPSSIPEPFYLVGTELWTGHNYSDYTAINAIGEVEWTWPSSACGLQTLSATDGCGRSASLSILGIGGTWSATSVDTSQSPVGWVVGEWNYNGTKRSKLTIAPEYYSSTYVGESNACTTHTDGWSGGYYYAKLGDSTGIGHCSGVPVGDWWDGDCTEGAGLDHRLPADNGNHCRFTNTNVAPQAGCGTFDIQDFTPAPRENFNWYLVKRLLEIYDIYKYTVTTEEYTCP